MTKPPRITDRAIALKNLHLILQDRRLRYWTPFYRAHQGLAFSCGPAMYDRAAAFNGWQELSVSAGLPDVANVVGGISFWRWEEAWEGTWDARLIGQTDRNGLMIFELEGYEVGDPFWLCALVAEHDVHQITCPIGDQRPLEIEVDDDEYSLLNPAEGDVEIVHRGIEDQYYLRFTSQPVSQHLPEQWFSLAASGDEETKWYEFSDSTGKIQWRLGRPGENWIIEVTIDDRLLSEPRFAIVKVLDPSDQTIAKAFVGLYESDDENRSEGEIVLNVAAPIIQDLDAATLRDHSFRVEPGRTEQVSIEDSELLQSSLLATDHPVSREVLETILSQLG